MTDVQAPVKLGFAMGKGIGKMIIPSPLPGEVVDLVLAPYAWSYVNPAFLNSHIFRRERKKGSFEFVEMVDPPEDVDVSIAPEYDEALSPDQREMVRLICATELTDQIEAALSVAEQVSESGIPKKDSLVTVSYLRERHRPMLLAIQDLEKRLRKRKKLLNLIKRNLEKIAALPS